MTKIFDNIEITDTNSEKLINQITENLNKIFEELKSNRDLSFLEITAINSVIERMKM